MHVVDFAPRMMAWMPPLAPLGNVAQYAAVWNRSRVMPNSIALIGLDIAKSVFQVHAADRNGRPITKRKLKRDEVAAYFRGLAPCIVGLQACPGGHYWARVIRGFGHEVRLLPAQYVRPFVKTNKNDAADAEAICEAMTRPTMRFVPIKEKQQEVLVIHRVRELLMRQRTQLINAIGAISPSSE
jgi:transposase